jgi:molecular chaperone Hsp33
MNIMKDYLLRGTALDGKVRAFAVVTTHLTEELRFKHNTSPTATAALGRVVAAALMMGSMLKNEEKLTIQVKGGGPIGQIVVDANAKGEVRGYVDSPQIDIPLNEKGKLDVSHAVGENGFLYVIKDLGMKEPYRGSVPIVSGEIAEDITYYFAKSEQIPSAVMLGVLIEVDCTVRASGGIIIQLLPGLTEQEISEIEQVVMKIPPLTSMLDQKKTIEQILHDIFPSIHILEKSEVFFRCKCSWERVEQTLLILGKTEITDMLKEEGFAELICQFCNQAYHFDESHLLKLINQ